ncbi:MAG: phage baseplate assembly protein V [Agarilytica sp.]
MNTEFLLAELNRRLANMIKTGRIHSVDLTQSLPKVRVKIGELTTGWLPFLTQRAGTDTQWWPIELEEQVLVVSPSGDLAQGIVIGSLFQNQFPPPSLSESAVRTEYSDGAVIEYDKESHHLQVILPAGGRLEVVADGGVSIVGDVSVEGNITASGDVTDATRSMQADREIYNNHNHPGVTTGGGSTAPTTNTQ